MALTTNLSTYPTSPNYHQGVKYPSPFFDLSTTYLPESVSQLYQYCEYYFYTNALVNSVINKMSEYPITDLIFEHEQREVRNRWEEYDKEVLNCRALAINIGWEYYTFGICYISLQFPFVKELKCKSCGKWFDAKKTKSYWKFTNFRFQLSCPSCGHRDTAEVRDVYLKNVKKVRVIRWSPKQVTISHNDITGDTEYYYKPKNTTINDLTMGIKDVVATTPQYVISVAKDPSKQLLLNKNNLFVLKRPSLSSRDTGYGMPLILPVMKDLFYLQVLKRAQEAISSEHIIPQRVVFPQAGTQSGDPVQNFNLANWRREVKHELANFKRDPNYLPVLGFPLGMQSIGGDGRALLLAQEIQTWSNIVVAGMGVPSELIFGGVSWSGSNISLRMLENMFLGYRDQLTHLFNFIFNKLAAWTGWQSVEVNFRPFKMADDLQRKMYMLQLNQMGKISDKTLLEDSDLDSVEEDKLMQKEAERRTKVLKQQQKASAEMQGETMMTQAKYQQRVQEMQQEAMQEQQMSQEQAMAPSPPEMNLNAVTDRLANQIAGMAPPEATKYMAALKSRHPDLAQAVQALVDQKATSLMADSAGAPLPEQKPPRREGPSV